MELWHLRHLVDRPGAWRDVSHHPPAGKDVQGHAGQDAENRPGDEETQGKVQGRSLRAHARAAGADEAQQHQSICHDGRLPAPALANADFHGPLLLLAREYQFPAASVFSYLAGMATVMAALVD